MCVHACVCVCAVVEEAVQKWGGYLSYRTHFVWTKITFLWNDSKNWGGSAPLAPPILPPMCMHVCMYVRVDCGLFIITNSTALIQG